MKPTLHSSEMIYQGFFNLRMDRLSLHGDDLHDYTSVIIPWSAAVVLAQDCEEYFILNSEYRHPTGQFLLGCPGGRLEEGEECIAAGQRELYEETGYWSDELTLLGSCYPFPSLCNQKIFFLHAKNAFLKGNNQCDPLECIEIERFTEAELRREIREGRRPIDGILCAALWYKSLIIC